MIIFLYGQDTYRLRQKLTEIITEYKSVHQSGLELARFDNLDLRPIKEKIESVSMFSEKKLIILENLSASQSENLIDYIKKNKLAQSEDVILVFYQPGQPDKRTKAFKFLNKKPILAQNFELLQGSQLENWIKEEIAKRKGQIEPMALQKLIFFVGSDLWQMKNEIDKLTTYDKQITTRQIDLLVQAKIDTNIFDTVDALGQRDKKKALRLLHQHLAQGENEIYLFTMLIYQLRNLLKLKSLEQKQVPYYSLAKQTGLHPFVVKKSLSQIRNFSLDQLKKIYQRLLEIEIDIKRGKIDSQTALDLLIIEI